MSLFNPRRTVGINNEWLETLAEMCERTAEKVNEATTAKKRASLSNTLRTKAVLFRINKR